MTALFLPALIGFTAGLCVTLALRRPLRRQFGPGCAYATWVLPPAFGAIAWLPPLGWTPALPANIPQTMHAIVLTASTTTASVHLLPWLALATWSLGVIALLSRLTTHYVRIHRSMRPLSQTLRTCVEAVDPELVSGQVREHACGPAVVAGWRSCIVLPADFGTRFDTCQQRLVLAHERTHLRRGDAWWNLLAELVCAVLWFHPLVWFARKRFRLDQEMACDASVLARHPHERRGYARALLQGIDRPAVPALATWLDEPQLKERLHMIGNFTQNKIRRRGGMFVLLGLMLGGAFAAQAMQPASPTQDKPATRASVNQSRQTPPVYPASAIKNQHRGTVVLKVKVGTRGNALEVLPMPGKAAPELVEAAVNAAKKWHFKPAENAHGKAVAGWVKVPVTFALDKHTPATIVLLPKDHQAANKDSK
jgi:TonB family protein